jgi:hypothetical protein
MNARARILLLEVPKLLRDILQHATRNEVDFELESETEPATPPDVVILGLAAAEDVTLVPTLFARWPAAQVLTVMNTGGDVVAYELSPQPRPLGELSPAEILVALRESIRRRRELAGEVFVSTRRAGAEASDGTARMERGHPNGC